MSVYQPEWVQADAWRALAQELHAEGWVLASLCGLDAMGLGFDHRFEAVAQLLHHERRERRTIHVAASGEPPTVPSVVDLWPTARFMEREAFDLVGVVFEGHDNLSRIMLPDEWVGHPLRKDYGVGKVEIEFIPQPFMQIDTPGQSTMRGEARVELDHLGQVVEIEETPEGAETTQTKSETAAT